MARSLDVRSFFKSLRTSAIAAVAASIFATAAPAATTACSGTCSESQQTACNNSHSQCVSNCGDGTKIGASGLPEPDPNYQGCVKSCNTSLCSCLDDCGDDCDESKGNLSGS
jgi:hypothetical protein